MMVLDLDYYRIDDADEVAFYWDEAQQKWLTFGEIDEPAELDES